MKTCEVKIFGYSFVLSAEVDDSEIKRVAEFVDQRMREVASASPHASALQVAVLTALDIASDKSLSANAENEIVKKIDDRADALLKLLDAHLPN